MDSLNSFEDPNLSAEEEFAYEETTQLLDLAYNLTHQYFTVPYYVEYWAEKSSVN